MACVDAHLSLVGTFPSTAWRTVSSQTRQGSISATAHKKAFQVPVSSFSASSSTSRTVLFSHANHISTQDGSATIRSPAEPHLSLPSPAQIKLSNANAQLYSLRAALEAGRACRRWCSRTRTVGAGDTFLYRSQRAFDTSDVTTFSNSESVNSHQQQLKKDTDTRIPLLTSLSSKSVHGTPYFVSSLRVDRSELHCK